MQRKPDTVEWILGAIIVVAVFFVWSSSKSNNDSVATIQIKDVANEVGYTVQARRELRKEQERLANEFNRQAKALSKDIDDLRKDYGESPTPEQLESINVRQRTMKTMLDRIRNANNEALSRMEMQQQQDFFNLIRPIITKISVERNFSVVLDRVRSGLVYFDPANDITETVITELKKQDGSLEEPPVTAPGTP